MVAGIKGLEHIQFDVRRLDPEYAAPIDDVPPAWWAGGRDVIREAFGATMKSIGQEAIDEFVGSPHDFQRVHRDPNILTEEGRVRPQLFSRPLMAAAFHWPGGDEMPKVVGVALSTDGVSGQTKEIRQRKSYIPFSRYRWLEKIAVNPDFQGRGIGSVLAMLSFRQAWPLQPASAYTWPAESDDGARFLESIGLIRQAGTTAERPFGEAYGDVEQVWYRARSARSVAHNILKSSSERGHLKELWTASGLFMKFLDSLDREHFSQNPKGG